MKIPAGFTEHLRGIDVSAWQGRIDWPRVYKEAGPGTSWNLHFVGVKVGERDYPSDLEFKRNWAGSRDAGFSHRIAYYFFHPNVAPRVQVDRFVSSLIDAGGLMPGDIIACDFEKDVNTPASIVRDNLAFFIELAQNATLQRCMVYTGAWYANNYLPKDSPVGRQPLWVSNYDGAHPILPKAWSNWDIWQYGADGYGSVPGIPVGDRVDHDLFRSNDPQELRHFAQSLILHPKEQTSE